MYSKEIAENKCVFTLLAALIHNYFQINSQNFLHSYVRFCLIYKSKNLLYIKFDKVGRKNIVIFHKTITIITTLAFVFFPFSSIL